MGTKNNPGAFDCYANALPDEEMFILLARDKTFEKRVRAWATDRHLAIMCGDQPMTDMKRVEEAMQCAINGALWRRTNNGIWRKPRTNINECPSCKRMFVDGETCSRGGCPMGGDV